MYTYFVFYLVLMTIHKAAGIIIRDRKLLVEKSNNKEFFIAPGGSIEEGETPQQALVRELMEEFQIQVTEDDLEYFDTFSAPAAGQEEKQVVMEVFTVKKFTGEPTPDNEVEKIAWITSSIPIDMKIGSIFEHEVLPRLKANKLVD
jgi:8-oxo-dGTP diphosphatase